MIVLMAVKDLRHISLALTLISWKVKAIVLIMLLCPLFPKSLQTCFETLSPTWSDKQNNGGFEFFDAKI